MFHFCQAERQKLRYETCCAESLFRKLQKQQQQQQKYGSFLGLKQFVVVVIFVLLFHLHHVTIERVV